MNYTPTFGWYYESLSSRAPAWSGVEQLYNFLINNTGKGPFAVRAAAADMRPGDVVQLTFNGTIYGHSLFVISAGAVGSEPNNSNIFTATHTFDSDYLPLDYWTDVGYRYIHIQGAK